MEPTTTKEKESVLAAAREYVDRQLAAMKSFGNAPKLTHADYDELVKKVAAATRRVRGRLG